jgi:hypothetical protein
VGNHDTRDALRPRDKGPSAPRTAAMKRITQLTRRERNLLKDARGAVAVATATARGKQRSLLQARRSLEGAVRSGDSMLQRTLAARAAAASRALVIARQSEAGARRLVDMAEQMVAARRLRAVQEKCAGVAHGVARAGARGRAAAVGDEMEAAEAAIREQLAALTAGVAEDGDMDGDAAAELQRAQNTVVGVELPLDMDRVERAFGSGGEEQ